MECRDRADIKRLTDLIKSLNEQQAEEFWVMFADRLFPRDHLEEGGDEVFGICRAEPLAHRIDE